MATIVPSDVIDGVVVEPAIHGDERGIFIETYRRQWFPGGREMIQGNRGDRKAGAVVGLNATYQADFGTCPTVRPGSCCTTCGWVAPPRARPSPSTWAARPGPGVDHDHRGVYIPPGVAHGFAA